MIRDSDNIITAIIGILGSVVVVIAPSYYMLITIFFAVITDTIIAFIRMVYSKEKWNWDKFYGLFVKIFIYLFIFFVLFLLDSFILSEFYSKFTDIEHVISKAIGFFLIWRELTSIDRSIQIMNKGKGFRYYFKELINTSQGVMKDAKKIKDDYDKF